MGKNQHVVPHKGEWAIRGEGNKRVTSRHPTQKTTIQAAKPIARRQSSEVVTHRPNGTIRDKDSYGNDPCPPKDKIN